MTGSGVSDGAVALSSVFMSQGCTLTMVSLNRNAHKTRVCTDPQRSMLGPEGLGNLTRYFRQEWGSIPVPSVCGHLVGHGGHRAGARAAF